MFVIFPRKHGMYVLKQAYLKKINSEESYQFYDISKFTIQQILDSFVDGYFELTHRQLKGTFYLPLEKLRNSNVPLIPSLTLQDWFGTNAKLELNTVKSPILYKKGIVKYSDAVLAGYEISRIGRRMKKDANISNADKVDLLVEKNSVPKQDLTNKCVFLVLAGHLIVSDKVVEIVNFDNGYVKINTKELRIIDMILDSVGKINLDDIGVFTVGDKEATNYKVRYQDIISDICVKKLFLLPQSFLVIVDADSIGINRIATQTTGLPTVYEYHEEPSLPLMSSRGLLQEYWKQESTFGWLIKTTDDIEKFKMNETVLLENFNMLNKQGYRYRWYHDKPEFVQIETVTKVK